MNSSSKVMKLVLPPNFQETVIVHEMKFDKGDKNVNLIRNLLYLYSIGTEYYDSVNNSKLYNYYQEKSIKLLTNDEVISILEKDKDQNKYLKANKKVDLFSDKMYKIVEKEDVFSSVYSMTEANIIDSSFLNGFENRSTENATNESSTSFEPSPKKANTNDICSLKKMYNTEPRNSIFEKEFQVEKDKLLVQFQSNFSKAKDFYKKDLNSQMVQFELLKNQKIKGQSEKLHKSKPFIKRDESTLKACLNPKKEDTLNILNNILELNEKKALCIQNQVQLEIESFINNNLKEMYKNLDELKQSYEKEIKLMEENGYPHVCRSLEEDKKNEMDVLKEQFEELRRVGIEKINLKYNKLLK